MTKRSTKLLCLVGCIVSMSVTVASSADAQRRGGRAGGMRPGAGGGGTRQDIHVRRDANTSINYNRNINRNVNRNLNVDVDVHHSYGYGYRDYHPIARAAAVATAAAIVGSYYRSLPTNCVVVYRVGLTYYQCGSAWYRPTYVGSDIQYVVVTVP
jgi:hypothetical protein